MKLRDRLGQDGAFLFRWRSYLPLLLLVALPFVGSLLAAFLPANARNTESTIAGLIAISRGREVWK